MTLEDDAWRDQLVRKLLAEIEPIQMPMHVARRIYQLAELASPGVLELPRKEG